MLFYTALVRSAIYAIPYSWYRSIWTVCIILTHIFVIIYLNKANSTKFWVSGLNVWEESISQYNVFFIIIKKQEKFLFKNSKPKFCMKFCIMGAFSVFGKNGKKTFFFGWVQVIDDRRYYILPKIPTDRTEHTFYKNYSVLL